MRLYLIQCTLTRSIKVGITTDLPRRLKTHQCGSPTRLACIASWRIPPDKARSIEATIHRLLKHHRQHGEWFDPQIEQTVKHMIKWYEVKD